MEYFISVVIPNYNRKVELCYAIDSVLQQSLQPDEIIVVDDYSKFEVQDVLSEKGYLADARIRVIRNKVNLGCGGSRNVGIENAKGNLVALLDSDDYWHQDKLQKQVQLFIQNSELDMVYCDTWVVENGKTKSSAKKLYNTDIWNLLINGWTPPNPSTLLIKKSALDRLKGFDADLKHNEDLDFWLRLSNLGMKVDFCPEPLSYFNFDSGDRMSKEYKEKFRKVEAFLVKWKAFFMANNKMPVYSRFKNKTLTRYAIETFVNSVKEPDVSTSLEVYVKYLWNRTDFYAILYNKFIRN